MKTSVITNVIEYASKAPSGHNTQPWRFFVKESGVEIHPDFKRALPVADPDHRELYISLGCALANLEIASNNLGYAAMIQYPESKNGTYIDVEFQKAEPKMSELFDQITQRQVRRNAYSEKTIRKENLDLFESQCSSDEVSLSVIDNEVQKTTLKRLILEANYRLMKNRKFKKELIRWMRFSRKQACSSGDGLALSTMGLPWLGRFFGNIMMKLFVTPGSENKRLKALMESTPHFVLMSVKEDISKSWIKAGQLFQKFGLMATKLDISHAHLNMPCEVPEIRQKLISELGLQLNPVMVLRLGYSVPMNSSYRRNINTIIFE